MTRHSDYRSEMNHHPDTPSRDDLEVLLRGRSDQADPLEVFGEVLRAMGELPAPPPSPALAEFLALPVIWSRPTSSAKRRRRVIAGVTALGVASLFGTGLAAAADHLPRPAQRVVADLTASWLPGAIPSPPSQGTGTRVQSGSQGQQDGPSTSTAQSGDAGASQRQPADGPTSGASDGQIGADARGAVQQGLVGGAGASQPGGGDGAGSSSDQGGTSHTNG